jgi:hypothetical protein
MSFDILSVSEPAVSHHLRNILQGSAVLSSIGCSSRQSDL